jgi:hypothetical protein
MVRHNKGKPMKYLLALLLMISISSSAAKWECVRWTWTGDVYNRVVTCLEWRDRDAPKIEKKK